MYWHWGTAIPPAAAWRPCSGDIAIAYDIEGIVVQVYSSAAWGYIPGGVPPDSMMRPTRHRHSSNVMGTGTLPSEHARRYSTSVPQKLKSPCRVIPSDSDLEHVLAPLRVIASGCMSRASLSLSCSITEHAAAIQRRQLKKQFKTVGLKRRHRF